MRAVSETTENGEHIFGILVYDTACCTGGAGSGFTFFSLESHSVISINQGLYFTFNCHSRLG